jgi:hypothetical protein
MIYISVTAVTLWINYNYDVPVFVWYWDAEDKKVSLSSVQIPIISAESDV